MAFGTTTTAMVLMLPKKKERAEEEESRLFFFSRDKIDIKYKLVHEYSFGAVSKCPFFV